MHDSTKCRICRGQPLGGSLTDQQFAAFLDACRTDVAARQTAFNQRIAGSSTWHYDMNDVSLTIGSLRFPMTPIGTFSSAYQSWLWAWANEDFPSQARAAAEPIKSLHDLTGFRVFADPGIPASSADAQTLAILAVHQLGAIGFFRCPSEEPVLYLAVHEPPAS